MVQKMRRQFIMKMKSMTFKLCRTIRLNLCEKADESEREREREGGRERDNLVWNAENCDRERVPLGIMC